MIHEEFSGEGVMAGGFHASGRMGRMICNVLHVTCFASLEGTLRAGDGVVVWGERVETDIAGEIGLDWVESGGGGGRGCYRGCKSVHLGWLFGFV